MSDSRHPDFDWHVKGLWMVIDPDNVAWHASLSDTPYGCRATFLRLENRPWSRLAGIGYYVQEFVRAG